MASNAAPRTKAIHDNQKAETPPKPENTTGTKPKQANPEPKPSNQLSEFGEKKDVARVLEQKELKVSSLTQEVNGLRSQVRSKDRLIFGFKRELSSMVHIGLLKDLEQAVKVRRCVMPRVSLAGRSWLRRSCRRRR